MQPSAGRPEYDVIVVGFGPSGAVAACSLGQAGLRTLVIDKSRVIWDIPRAIAIDHEILRVFQNLGVAEQVLDYTAPFPVSEHFGAQGQLIRRIDAVPPPYPLGYLPTMVFTQPAVEAVLRARAVELPSVAMSLGLEVVGLEQSADCVTLETRDEVGCVQYVTASYVVACDGASSRVRQCLGISLDDLGFDEPWMVIDAKVNETGLTKLPQTAAQYCDPARPATFIIGPGNHRRWEIMLLPGEDPKIMDREENVWKLLAPWLTTADGDIWRANSYRFHALVAAQWRKGRVFLAGDAAHQQPPFIGQGMCQGIRDVTNLSWKLRSVLSCEADESLLDTYADERSGHVRTLTARIQAIGRSICERNPEAARLRDEQLIKQGGGAAPTITRQEIVPPLDSGLLNEIPHPANGTLFPQPWILTKDGPRHMDDLFPDTWRIVADGRHVSAASLAAYGLTTIIIGGPGLTEQDKVAAAWFDRYDCIAAVVRPDHYVYGVIIALSEVEPILGKLRKRLTSPGPDVAI